MADETQSLIKLTERLANSLLRTAEKLEAAEARIDRLERIYAEQVFARVRKS